MSECHPNRATQELESVTLFQAKILELYLHRPNSDLTKTLLHDCRTFLQNRLLYIISHSETSLQIDTDVGEYLLKRDSCHLH